MILQKIIPVLIVACGLSLQARGQHGRTPVTRTGRHYTLEVDKAVLEIDPVIGGRITALRFKGRNFLTDSTVDPFNWGSTFWPSPQSDWHWPPAAAIDNGPYTATLDGDTLIMVSGMDPATGLVVAKAISGDRKMGAFVIKYTLTNRSAQPQKVAPWEVTRVHTEGLAFFPAGQGKIRGGLLSLITREEGLVWFTYREAGLPRKGDRQIYADGSEGWLAEVNDGIVLVKCFPDISPEETAPAEGEVELYASPVKRGQGYVEIEHQGAYGVLAPGASASWTVTWILRKIPGHIHPKAGSRGLAAFVRKLVAGR